MRDPDNSDRWLTPRMANKIIRQPLTEQPPALPISAITDIEKAPARGRGEK